MKLRTFFLLAALVALTGCQSIARHNAQTRQQLSAADATAAQARAIAAKAKQSTQGIAPINSPTP